MKNGETKQNPKLKSPKSPKLKRPVAKKGKRGLNPKALKAAAVFAETGSKTAACKSVGVDPRHSDRLLNRSDAQNEVERHLKDHGMGPEWIVRKLKWLGDAMTFVTSDAANLAVMYARESRNKQIEMFDPHTLMPKRTAPGAVADTATQIRVVELAAKLQGIGQGDPDYGRKMFEAGMEAATKPMLELMARLKVHMTSDGVSLMETGLLALNGGDGGAE